MMSDMVNDIDRVHPNVLGNTMVYNRLLHYYIIYLFIYLLFSFPFSVFLYFFFVFQCHYCKLKKKHGQWLDTGHQQL